MFVIDEHKDNDCAPSTKEQTISKEQQKLLRAVLHCQYYWNIPMIELFRNGSKVDLDKEMEILENCHNKHEPIAVMEDGELVEQNCDEEVFIHMEVAKSRKYKCPCCGKMVSLYDHRDRCLSHTDFLGRKCTLVVSVPRLECKKCGILRLEFPGAKPDVTYTYEFERWALIEAFKGSLSAAARTLHVGRWIVSDIFHKHVDDAIAALDLSYVTEIFVDDFYLGKNLGYVTIICDKHGNVIYITKGRDADVIRKFADYLLAHGGHPDNIRVVSADMSGAYESWTVQYLPNAKLVWDRFHLVKSINDVINTIRRNKVKRKKGEKLRGIRYVVLRRTSNMDDDCKAKLKEIRLRSPELALNFDMKEVFCELLLNTDGDEAVAEFEEWYAWVMALGCTEMKKRAELFKAKADRIFAWIDHRVSNSVAEGVNSRIRKVIGQSYGFSNVDNFISMTMFRLGRLTIYV